MNLFRKFFFGTATLALLAGCSDDISNAGQNIRISWRKLPDAGHGFHKILH